MSKGAGRNAIIVVIVLVIGGAVAMHLAGRSGAPGATGGPQSPGHAGGTGTPPRQLPPVGLTLQGQVVAAERREVTAPVNGRVVALAAPEGQPVVEGQLLLQLDVPQLRQELAAAQKRLKQLQALQDKAQDPDLRDRLHAAEQGAEDAAARAKQMQADLENFGRQFPEAATVEATFDKANADAAAAQETYLQAQREFDQAQMISGKTGKAPPNFIALRDKFVQAQTRNREAQELLEQARQALARLRTEIEQLRRLRARVASGNRMAQQMAARLEHLKQTPEVAMIAQGQQRVQQAADAVKRLEGQAGQLGLKAPVTGQLIELKARPGQSVQAGAVLAVIRDTSGPRLVFQATPKEAKRLTVGQRAQVEVTGGRGFEAAVSQIVPGKAAVQVYVVPLRHTTLPAGGTALVARL